MAGPTGGHSKHLARHKLRLRTRHTHTPHGQSNPPESNGILDNTEIECELQEAQDGGLLDYTLIDSERDLLELDGLEYDNDTE